MQGMKYNQQLFRIIWSQIIWRAFSMGEIRVLQDENVTMPAVVF